MDKFSLDEMHGKILELCPDYAGIQVTHMGRYRTKVDAVTYDGKHVQIVIGLNEEDMPITWAKQFAVQLHTVQIV